MVKNKELVELTVRRLRCVWQCRAWQLSRTWVCCGSSTLRSCSEGWPAASRVPSGASSTRAWSSIRRSPATSLRAPQPEFPALPLGTTGRRRTPCKTRSDNEKFIGTCRIRCGWLYCRPAVDVQVAEDDARSVASEEFEAALRVLDRAHAHDAHEEVEALHQEGSEDWPLKGERYNKFRWDNAGKKSCAREHTWAMDASSRCAREPHTMPWTFWK